MKTTTNRTGIGALIALGAFLMIPLMASADEPEENLSFDNLVEIEDSDVMAYLDPDADFSVYSRVALAEPQVAFRRNWRRDQNRSRSRNVTTRDMDRIKADVATEFARVFTDRLEEAGYEVVETAADDVLLIRPSIIDLDVTAPDLMTAGRQTTFAASAGAATLVIELFDSVSGDIIGRATDREVVRRHADVLTWTNRVTNIADARRMFNGWADHLIAFLDRQHKPDM